MTNQEFIDSIKNDALRYQQKSGIPASIIIAQACLETGYGKYVCKDIVTGKDSKNLFNIKGIGNNGFVLVWTTEYYDGVKTKVQARFKAYKTYEDSFADYAKLLLINRYKPAMAVKDNPIEFANKLYECGYATDPNYADKLIWIMKNYRLLESGIMTKEQEELLRTFAVTQERIITNKSIDVQLRYLIDKCEEYLVKNYL